MPSLSFGQELLVVAFSCLISIFLVVGSLVGPSFILALLFQFFNVTLKTGRPIVLMLFCVAVSGVCSLIAISMLWSFGWWFFTAIVISIALAYFWGGKHVDHAKVSESNCRAKMRICAKLIVSLTLVMILNLIFSAPYMDLFYESKVVVAGGWDKSKYVSWFVLSAGSLLPCIFMYLNAKDGVAAKIKCAFFGLVIYVILLLMIVPKIFFMISAMSIGFLGGSEQEVRHYLIDSKKQPKSSLDANRWVVREVDEHHYALNAFALYEFGPVNLLCPADLSKVEIWNIKPCTHVCIDFRQDAVRKLGAVEQNAKPVTDSVSEKAESENREIDHISAACSGY